MKIRFHNDNICKYILNNGKRIRVKMSPDTLTVVVARDSLEEIIRMAEQSESIVIPAQGKTPELAND